MYNDEYDHHHGQLLDATIKSIRDNILSHQDKLDIAQALGFVLTYDAHNQIVLQTGIYQSKDGTLGSRKST